MNVLAKPSPEAIRRARIENPKLRERDLAGRLAISEAEFTAAHCGDGAKRLDLRFDDFFSRAGELGEVMALTRNASAVHEKIGAYDKFHAGRHAAMFLGDNIDLRMFPAHWKHLFAVEKRDGEEVRRSLQFFDPQGDAVHKIHARPGTDLKTWDDLVEAFASPDQTPTLETEPEAAGAVRDGDAHPEVPLAELRERWAGMTDTHQFVPLIRKLKLTRHRAVNAVGEDFAWRLSNDAVGRMLLRSAEEALPIMCFVGSRGCIQIHSGPVETIRLMGPWLNVMDPTFHLHLRTDHIAEIWAVRKPTDNAAGRGHVTSLETYDAAGNLIIQFFGKRVEGQDERPAWRAIMESLPRPALGNTA